MPIFEYQCSACGKLTQIISKAPGVYECCGRQMEPVISAPARTPERWK